MPTTYHSSYFISPKDEGAIKELQTVPHVFVGFIIRNNSMQRPQEFLGPKMPLYISNDHHLDGGARFMAMVIKSDDIPLMLRAMGNGDIGLLGFYEATKWPRPSLVSMDFPEIKKMLPLFVGRHSSPLLNDVTIQDDWDVTSASVGRGLSRMKNAIRGWLHRPSAGDAPHA